MNELIRHQVIEKDGQPLFVIVPYEEYLTLIIEEQVTIPQEVVECHILDGMSLIRAWREYKGYSQQEIAARMHISQSAYSQMERSDARLRQKSIEKIADALDIDSAQLDI